LSLFLFTVAAKSVSMTNDDEAKLLCGTAGGTLTALRTLSVGTTVDI